MRRRRFLRLTGLGAVAGLVPSLLGCDGEQPVPGGNPAPAPQPATGSPQTRPVPEPLPDSPLGSHVAAAQAIGKRRWS